MVHRANVGSGLDYVEFFASHEADLRILHDLVILVEIVESSELGSDEVLPASLRQLVGSVELYFAHEVML